MGSAGAIVAQILKFWGNLIPADVFASYVARTQAQISPKFLKPEMQKTLAGIKFPKIPKILASTGSVGAIVAQMLGILGKVDPCQCFRISGFRNFGKI